MKASSVWMKNKQLRTLMMKERKKREKLNQSKLLALTADQNTNG